MQNKKEHPKEKIELHPRNKHRERYDFKLLIESNPALAKFVKLNTYQDESIDFFNPEAVKMLNTSLLKQYYGIDFWSVPHDYLCPPIPGRADYIHNMADLLGISNEGKIPTGDKIRVLDIGVGANCVYPIIGNKEYGWSFVGSDIDAVAIKSANKIIDLNLSLKGKVELRLQPNPIDIFHRIIQKDERFELTICNPPFHASIEEAQAGTIRKLSNLKHKSISKPRLNFGGNSLELVYEGGEKRFVQNMIRQSKRFSDSCLWFSTLVSKRSNMEKVYKDLEIAEAQKVKTIPMGQGNKISRIIAWTFLTFEEHQIWMKSKGIEIR